MQITILIFTLTILFSSFASSSEIVRDNEENYMSLKVLPLCQVNGQVSVSFTNVSGKRLLVDPNYGSVERFDVGRQAVDLYTLDLYPVMSVPRKYPDETADWAVFSAGQSVEHIIDFREHTPDLDTSKGYVVLTSAVFNVITEEGKTIRLTLDSGFLDERVEFDPSCFK